MEKRTAAACRRGGEAGPAPPWRSWLLPATLAFVLLLRLLSLGAYPLTDTSEARFGEIARKMLELRDWVTPWYDYGVPYWGKPPLAFWLAAAAARVLGVSEFALRLPSFLLGLAMLALVAGMARRARDAEHAWVAVLALASAVLFFVASGAVLTDTALAFCTTLAMAAFWHGVAAPTARAALWRYLLFAALGLGLLAKGPVALVLAGAPIALWALFTRHLARSLGLLPWAGGTALMLLIALPWYVLAEQHTPGFLRYFLIGENFRRFADPHWVGLLYGNLHARPYGYIWLLLPGTVLLWSALWLAALLRDLFTATGVSGRLSAAAAFFRGSPWRLYLLCFALAPPVFFTFASSVLATYLLPALPALALLLAEWWQARHPVPRPALLAGCALLPALLFVVALPFFNASLAADKSQRRLLAYLPSGASVVYFPQRPFSAQFYSQGRAHLARDEQALLAAVAADPDAYLVTYAGAALPAALEQRYRAVAESGRRRHSVLWQPARVTGARSPSLSPCPARCTWSAGRSARHAVPAH